MAGSIETAQVEYDAAEAELIAAADAWKALADASPTLDLERTLKAERSERAERMLGTSGQLLNHAGEMKKAEARLLAAQERFKQARHDLERAQRSG